MLELEEDCALEEETAEELDWIALEEEIAEELDFPELLEAGTTGLMAIPLQRTSSMYK